MLKPWRVQIMGHYAGIVFARDLAEARAIARESFGTKARIA